MYLLVLLLPNEVQFSAGPLGQHSAVNVFVSVSCVFVSICKKNTHNLSIVYCVFLIISRKLFGFIAVLSRCIEQSDVIS